MANHKPRTCKQCGRDLASNSKSIYCAQECKKKARNAQACARYARNREDKLQKAAKYRSENREKCLEATRRWRHENREVVRNYNRKWRANNPERTKFHRDKWAAANDDKMTEYKRKWANANREEVAARRHKSYIANRNAILEANRRWKANNPDKVGAYRAKRAAKELEGSATDAQIREKWNTSSKTCILCGEPISMKLPPLHPQARTIEHLTPLHRGGKHDIDNIDFAHRSCNARKGTKTLDEYRTWQAKIGRAHV